MIPNAMPPFDFGLGETADALRDQVQRFAAEEVAPIAAELDKTDRFPRELWPRMGELGLHGITVEEDYGGLGLVVIGLIVFAAGIFWGFSARQAAGGGVFSVHVLVGWVLGIAGIGCVATAVYFLLERLGGREEQ